MMPQLCSVRDLIDAFAKEGFVLVTDLDEPFLIFEREPHDLVHLTKGALVDEDGGVFLDILAQDFGEHRAPDRRPGSVQQNLYPSDRHGPWVWKLNPPGP